MTRINVIRRRGLIVAVLLGAAITALGARDLLVVRSSLTSVRAILAPATTAAESFDVASLRRVTTRASVPARRARSASRSVVLAGAARIPVLGRTVRTVRALAEASAGAIEGATELVEAAEAFPASNGRLDYGLSDGVLDLSPWAKAGPAAERAVAAIAAARRALDSSPGAFVLPPVSTARDEAARYLARLDSAAQALDDAARLVPPMLGANERRRYLVVLQNLSEQRATGGIPGGTVIIEADRGHLEVRDVASNLFIVEARDDVPQPEWFRRRYDRYASRRLWVNANAEPNFPVTAPLLAGLYHSIVGGRVDGVIAIDPLALEAFMAVTGPVRDPLDGTSVAADDIAPLILSDAYVRFPGAHGNLPRKRYFEALAATIWDGFSRTADLAEASGAMATATAGKHVQLWSAHPDEQRVIERIGSGGIVGTTQGRARGFAMITQSASGNKMDYYLRRSLDVAITPGGDGLVHVRAAMVLRNTGPSSGLPRYVLGPLTTVPTYRPGFIRTYFSAYLPPDAFVHAVAVDGRPSVYESERAPHALILSDFLTIYPGEQRRIVVEWSVATPVAGRALDLVFQKQPTVEPDEVSITYRPQGGGQAIPLVPRGQRDGDVRVTVRPSGGVLRRLSSLLSGA